MSAKRLDYPGTCQSTNRRGRSAHEIRGAIAERRHLIRSAVRHVAGERRNVPLVDLNQISNRAVCDLIWYQILIDHLKEARLQKGWSQTTLATRSGVSVQAVKRLECGAGSLETVVRVMSALDFHLMGLGEGGTLPEQLKSARCKRRMSITAVASKAGLSRATVASLEQGRGTAGSLSKVLAVVAPRARRRAPERAYWGQANKVDRDSRFTPPEFMEGVYAAFGPVDLDPCANIHSPVIAKRKILLTEGGDGLTDAWSGDLVFVNPPFSRLLVWLRRAHEQWHSGRVRTVVCLVPVRTDSAWFHETLSIDADMFLLQGRVRFLDAAGKSQHTPFSLMLVTLGATEEQKQRYATLVPGYWLTRSNAVA